MYKNRIADSSGALKFQVSAVTSMKTMELVHPFFLTSSLLFMAASACTIDVKPCTCNQLCVIFHVQVMILSANFAYKYFT
jgi:hypothetical protein